MAYTFQTSNHQWSASAPKGNGPNLFETIWKISIDVFEHWIVLLNCEERSSDYYKLISCWSQHWGTQGHWHERLRTSNTYGRSTSHMDCVNCPDTTTIFSVNQAIEYIYIYYIRNIKTFELHLWVLSAILASWRGTLHNYMYAQGQDAQGRPKAIHGGLLY